MKIVALCLLLSQGQVEPPARPTMVDGSPYGLIMPPMVLPHPHSQEHHEELILPGPVHDPSIPDEAISPYEPAPRETWWYGRKIAYGHQPTLYYPTWDRPIRTLLGFRPYGPPANVPHGVAIPHWYPIGR